METAGVKELVASHYAAVHNFDSAALHLSRGHSPYEKTARYILLCEQAPNEDVSGRFFALLRAGAKISLAEWGFLM